MSRVYNFSAGPAVLPEEVLREAAEEMMDYKLKPNEYYGTWVDNGKVYYDVSVNIPSERQATILALFRNELAIWDVENNEAIPMGIH